MYEGISAASRVTITEVMKGRMFLVAIRVIGVPRQRDARLYSLSLIMMTCVRMKYAIAIHPVMVSASTIVQKLGAKIMMSTEMRSM